MCCRTPCTPLLLLRPEPALRRRSPTSTPHPKHISLVAPYTHTHLNPRERERVTER
ncbi:hypothetical protein HanIR_Chr15g0741751 [Helianthus annuus]|nr:hypothetical protein HanIR_Chr15g0741751 [Helianthus annuus]